MQLATPLHFPKTYNGSAKVISIHAKGCHKADQRLLFNTHQGLVSIRFDHIQYCEAKGNYTVVKSSNGKSQLLSKNLKYIANELRFAGFVRTHQSYLVPLSRVQSVLSREVVLEDGTTIPLSRRLRQKIRNAFISFCQE